MICETCLYRVKSSRRYICEKTGKHLYYAKETCQDYTKTYPQRSRMGKEK